MHFPVTLQLKPSRRLRAALVFAHALSALCLFVVDPQGFVALFGTLILALSLAWWLRRITTPVELQLMPDGGLRWNDRSGRLLAGSVAFSGLVVLRVRLEGEAPARGLVVLRDSLTAADFRRLQVWLRWVVPIKAAATSA